MFRVSDLNRLQKALIIHTAQQLHTTLDYVFMFSPDLLPSPFYTAGTAAEHQLEN